MAGGIGAYLRHNVLGLVAIFLALSAGAYAVQKAPKNSVVSKSIKDGKVKSADIGDGEVGSVDLAADALSWSALQGVPAGFADGSDANSGGTVTSVGSGAGLTGGPITGTGSIRLDACPTGEFLKSNGAGYACGGDIDTNSGGDITGVSTDSPLIGGAVSGEVTVGLPDCPQHSVLRASGPTSWACSTNHWGSIGVGIPGAVSVAGDEVVFLQAGAPTPVTSFTGGVDGQRVTLVATNANVTLADGAASTKLSANWTPDADDTLTLINGSGSWHEVARSAN
jgi:hypothetical protein